MQWRTLLFSLFLEYILRFTTPYISPIRSVHVVQLHFPMFDGNAILYQERMRGGWLDNGDNRP